MRHARFDIARVAIEQVDVPLKAASLQVAEADDAHHLQWECLVYALDAAPVPPGRYQVVVTTVDGRDLQGEAVLVRSVGGAHVLRGDGPLAGVHDADLS